VADKVRWLTRREQRAWRAFLVSHIQLMGRLSRSLQRESGLSNSDYEVLVVLSESAAGRLRPFEVGNFLQWEKSRLSHHLRRMEERGLVTREACPTDGRGAFVVLTPRGRSTIEAAAPGHVAEVRRSFFDALSPAQVDALADIGDTVVSHLGALDEEDMP
jgi:DNA-binding MarR family transcriptional regulator